MSAEVNHKGSKVTVVEGLTYRDWNGDHFRAEKSASLEPQLELVECTEPKNEPVYRLTR